MIIKTEQEIEKMAEAEYPTVMWQTAPVACSIRDKQDGFKKGYKQALRDIKEQAIKGFQEYWDTEVCQTVGYVASKEAWQASQLSAEKKYQAKIAELESRLKEAEEIIFSASNETDYTYDEPTMIAEWAKEYLSKHQLNRSKEVSHE